jgi:hypothetical protein
MRWQYTWEKHATVSNWTYAQKKAFHTQVDRIIWGSWSNRINLRATGNHAFGKKFKDQALPINFDVQWVTVRPHWSVKVLKLPNNASETSFVNWSTNEIQLDTNDFTPHGACNDEAPQPGMEIPFLIIPPQIRDAIPGARDAIVDQSCKGGFKTIPHEFGHVLGNGNDDEYRADATHRADLDSLLNIGQEIRDRHLNDVLGELNTMLPDCAFAVHSIRN